MKIKLKSKETNIINKLRTNSREKLFKISEDLDIPITTTFSYVKRIEKKFIKRYCSLINYNALGKNALFLRFKSRKNKIEIIDELKTNKAVNTIKQLYDGTFFVEAVFNNLIEIEDFKKLFSYKHAKILDLHFMLEEISREKKNIF